MVRFLIASHGTFAEGLKSTVGIIMGPEVAQRVQTLCAFLDPDEISPKEQIDTIVEQLPAGDDLIILTDIMFGSVNQFAMAHAGHEHVYVISGINFPLVLELLSHYVFSDTPHVVREDLEHMIEQAQHELRLAEVDATEPELSAEQAEDDFFS